MAQKKVFGPDERMSRQDAADYMDVSVSKMDKQRAAGRGPRYRKVGERVDYTRRWLDEYLAGQVRETTDSRKAAA